MNENPVKQGFNDCFKAFIVVFLLACYIIWVIHDDFGPNDPTTNEIASCVQDRLPFERVTVNNNQIYAGRVTYFDGEWGGPILSIEKVEDCGK